MKFHPLLTGIAACLVLAAGCGDTDEASTAGVPPPEESAAAAPPPDTATLLDRALAGEHRSEQNRARDRYRHPKETLEFFGLEPGMTVVELYPGTGWYTEVLAPVLHDRGKLIAAQFEATAPPSYRPRVVAAYRDMLSGAAYHGTEMVTMRDDGTLDGIDDASVDMVLTFRNVHNWMTAGTFERILAESARVLKDGGVLGVVEHRAEEGVDPMESAARGYVPESYVIEKAREAGFELDARSDVNANPADTKDYAIGVWALPPSLRGDLDRREQMEAIGESDRMTLRFVKPSSAR